MFDDNQGGGVVMMRIVMDGDDNDFDDGDRNSITPFEE